MFLVDKSCHYFALSDRQLRVNHSRGSCFQPFVGASGNPMFEILDGSQDTPKPRIICSTYSIWRSGRFWKDSGNKQHVR